MRVIRPRPSARERSRGEIFRGKAYTQPVVDDGAGPRLLEVAFVNGARTKLHRHTSDQILLIEAGHGVVGTPSEKHEVAAGDVVVIPAGEAHFHGASDGQDMTHYSVLGAHNQTAVLE